MKQQQQQQQQQLRAQKQPPPSSSELSLVRSQLLDLLSVCFVMAFGFSVGFISIFYIRISIDPSYPSSSQSDHALFPSSFPPLPSPLPLLSQVRKVMTEEELLWRASMVPTIHKLPLSTHRSRRLPSYSSCPAVGDVVQW